MAKLSEIKQLLDEKNIEYRTIDLPSVAISVDDLVRLTNGQIKEDEIIKTLIVKIKSGEFVGCVLRGKDKLNMVKPFDRLATKEEVLRVANVEVGAVCPILLGVPIMIDNRVTDLDRVNLGSGDHLKGLEMKLDDMLTVIPNYNIKELAEKV